MRWFASPNVVSRLQMRVCKLFVYLSLLFLCVYVTLFIVTLAFDKWASSIHILNMKEKPAVGATSQLENLRVKRVFF